jgi:hypothetical protein
VQKRRALTSSCDQSRLAAELISKTLSDILLLAAHHPRNQENIDEEPEKSDQDKIREYLKDGRTGTSKIKAVCQENPEKKPEEIGDHNAWPLD